MLIDSAYRHALNDMLTIVVALDERGPMTKTEVAEATSLDRKNVSYLIDRMCQAGRRWKGYYFMLERDDHIKRAGPKKTPSYAYKIKVLECTY